MPPLDEKQSVVDDERPTGLGDQANSVLQKYPWLEWLIPVALCAAMLGQLPFSVRQVSQTADEATHLYSGYRYLKCGDLTVSPEHPPLAKVIAAAPLLAMNFAVNCAPFKGNDLQQAFASLTWLYSQNWPAALASARMAISIFAVGLCLLVWIAARRMFGITTAIVASLLLIFEPNVLAYGSLVMTDVPVTCMLLFAVLGFYLWVRQRTILFFLLTALAMGLTLLAKDSGVVVVPILGALAITDALAQPKGDRPKWQLALRNLLAVALISRPRARYCLVRLWNAFRRLPRSSATPGSTTYCALRQPARAARVRRSPSCCRRHTWRDSPGHWRYRIRVLWLLLPAKPICMHRGFLPRSIF